MSLDRSASERKNRSLRTDETNKLDYSSSRGSKSGGRAFEATFTGNGARIELKPIEATLIEREAA
jgi:hypothetical protein